MMKLGRKERAFNSSIPHMSALIGGKVLPPAPIEVDYSHGMPDNYGAMLNDQLGDCTCAAYFHAVQVWSFNGQHKEITNPDSDVLGLYEKACGYVPNEPSTDQGGVEQDVLTYLLKRGAPGCKPILAFVEVDPRNLDDVKRAIYETGCVYIGVNLPNHIVADGEPPAVWDVKPSDSIAGGHAIILCGYTLDGFYLISWGKKYFATNAFMSAYCDEIYAIVDQEWISATGKTPLNMSVQALESLMTALKYAPE